MAIVKYDSTKRSNAPTLKKIKIIYLSENATNENITYITQRTCNRLCVLKRTTSNLLTDKN